MYQSTIYRPNGKLSAPMRLVTMKPTSVIIMDTHPIIRMSIEVLLQKNSELQIVGFAPIFPDTCYHLTHYWPAAADIPVASDNPVHYADAIRYNARTPLQGSLLPLTRLV